MTIGTQFYHRWVFRGLPGSLHSHCNPPGGFSFVSLHFPFYRMCTHTHHSTPSLPQLWSCPSLGPDCFSFLLILFPILKLFSLILLTSVCLRLLLISKEIGDRPCLFLPCWGHSHLLFGSTHLSSPSPQRLRRTENSLLHPGDWPDGLFSQC